MAQTPHHFEAQITKQVQLDYLLYFPPDYDTDVSQRFPLIISLHGGGGRGSDLELVKQSGIALDLEQGRDLPFVVVSPQCPADSHWTLHTDALNALIGEVIERHRVDEDRVYLTGVSLGGGGTWMLAGAYPERFAAIAPIAARIVPLPLERLLNLPIRVFHGAQDELIPVSEAQRTVEALKRMGGSVELTVFPDAGHNIRERVYGGSDLFDWFLKQRRGKQHRRMA